MIRMEAIALLGSPWFSVTSGTTASYGSSQSIPCISEKTSNSVVITPKEKSITEVFEQDIGSLVQGKIPHGNLREKDVRHFQVDTTVVFPTTPFYRSYTSCGILRFQRTDLSWVTARSGHIFWFESGGWSFQVPSYQYTFQGELRNVTAATHDGYWLYLGDRAICVSHVHNPIVTRASDGTVRVAGITRTNIVKYRRSSNMIYSMGTYTEAGIASGGTEASILAAIPLTGGSSLSTITLRTATVVAPEDYFLQLVGGCRGKIREIDLDLRLHPADFGELGLECSKQLKYVDQNILLLVIDVGNLKTFLQQWRNLATLEPWLKAKESLARAIGQGSKVARLSKDLGQGASPLTSTYLMTNYGVLPSVSDCQRLVSGASKLAMFLKHQRLHSKKVTSIEDPTVLSATHTAVLTVECAKYPSFFTGQVQSVISQIKRAGLYPEITNLWDMIPYSFVVDWFVQFGDFFDDVNAYMDQENYFPIKWCIMSEKWEKSIAISSILPDILVDGVVEFSYYTRWISGRIPLPAVSLSSESLVSKHWLESTALIMQRLR